MHGSKVRTFHCCLVSMCCFETALKILGKLPQRGSPFHTFLQIFYKNFKILVSSYNRSHFVSIFKKIDKKTCPDTRKLLFLYNKELHKKFSPILIVCQRWRHSQKTKNGATFDLVVILTCRFFLKSYFLKVFQLKKQNYMLFVECSTALGILCLEKSFACQKFLTFAKNSRKYKKYREP